MCLILSSNKDSLWESNLYKDFEDLNSELRSKISINSKEYVNNLKVIYGGKSIVFKSINVFIDVNDKIKLGIEHCGYLDSRGRIYDPYLGFYDIDLKSYLNYIGYYNNVDGKYIIV